MKNIVELLNFKKNDASTASIPLEKTIYGVTIKKLPNGAYIRALNTFQNLPEILLEGCFPGMKADKIIEELQALDSDKLLVMAGKLIQVIPEQFLKLVSDLLDIPFEKLMDELSPNETIEILQAFWEKNDLSAFFERLKGMVMKSKLVSNLIKTEN